MTDCLEYPNIALIPTEELLAEVYERSEFCMMFAIESELDEEENTCRYVTKGTPALLGSLGGALVYDTAKMIYEELDSKEAAKSYVDNFSESYRESLATINDDIVK